MDADALVELLGQGEELRFEVARDRGPENFVRVSRGPTLVGALLARFSVDRVEVDIDFEPLTATRADVAHVVSRLAAASTAQPSDAFAVELLATDLLTRYEARRAGFAGGLRVPLIARGPKLASEPPIEDVAGLAAAVSRLAPGASVGAAPEPRGFGRLAREARAGVAGMGHLVVTPPASSPFVVAVPVRPDVMPETVALAIDTTLAVLAMFGGAIDHLRTVSFDYSDHGLMVGRYAGMANASAAVIHLNASFALADELLAMARTRALNPAPRQPAVIAGPFTRIDGTTAHELWHQIEAAFEARRYKESIQFRRQLGRFFELDTLEQVTNGGHPRSGPDERAAFVRLAREVSPYATTNPREATAEMFKQWWCTVGQPTPIVAYFGALLEQLFGVPRLPRERA